MAPLAPDPAAEDLVVVVVDGVGVAEAPHGVAGRRVHHPTVAVHGVQEEALKVECNSSTDLPAYSARAQTIEIFFVSAD